MQTPEELSVCKDSTKVHVVNSLVGQGQNPQMFLIEHNPLSKTTAFFTSCACLQEPSEITRGTMTSLPSEKMILLPPLSPSHLYEILP